MPLLRTLVQGWAAIPAFELVPGPSLGPVIV